MDGVVRWPCVRRLHWYILWSVLAILFANTCALSAKTIEAPTPEAVSVTDFGANGDGHTDNTAAFQRALDAVAHAGGGIVRVPAGKFQFKGHLTIGPNTTLSGIFSGPPGFVIGKGSLLLATEGRADENAPPFITFKGGNSTLTGLSILYPDQLQAPVAYPWCIADESGPAGNVSIINVALLNPYLGMKLGGRHFVSGVYGQPLRVGIFVDHCLDIGRIENVHFWPFWNNSPALRKWLVENGVAFEFARDDWQYMTNCFCLGYKIGYHFISGAEGPCNGSFVSIGSDGGGQSIVVEQSWPYGIQILNGEFVADRQSNSTGLTILPGNKGLVMLHNCAFWGPSHRNVYMSGTGQLILNGCMFRDWDQQQHTGEFAVTVDGGSAIITGNFFHGSGRHAVKISPHCSSAVVTSNMATSGPFVVDAAKLSPPDRFSFAQNVGGP